MEAFVYKWYDLTYNKIYIGVHKGATNDGYICSSKSMLHEYKERPNDFIRIIIDTGTFKLMRKLESELLVNVQAATNNMYYNLHNSDYKFYYTPRNINGSNNHFYGKKHSDETKKKMSNSKLGNIPWNKGRKIPSELNSMYGKKHTEETKQKMRKKRKCTINMRKPKSVEHIMKTQLTKKGKRKCRSGWLNF